MKHLIIALLTIISFHASSQDMIKVTYGKKTTKWYPIPEKGINVDIAKKNYSSISSITIDVKQQSVSEAYKRNIEITGDNGNFTCSVNESKTPGRYSFNLIPIRKALLKQKIIKVYLQQNPANDRMMMPSRQTLLAEIYLK